MHPTEAAHRILFTDDDGARIVERDFAVGHQFFDEYEERLHDALRARFPTFLVPRRKENPDNFGLYFFDPTARVPFFWFGLAWNARRRTPPAWGCSFEVIGPLLRPYREGVAGLRHKLQNLAAEHGAPSEASAPLGLYAFDAHVELASWHKFSWLTSQSGEEQPEALLAFWSTYLELLSGAGLEAAIAKFLIITRACGDTPW